MVTQLPRRLHLHARSADLTHALVSAALGLAVACGGEEPERTAEEAAAVVSPAAPCSAAKQAEVLAPATATAPAVVLGCSLTLAGAEVTVTKRLILQGAAASGVTVDCRGGTIRPTFGGAPSVWIRSTKVGTTWSRPESVTVQRCTIHGSVRVQGLGPNGEAAEVRESSHSVGHTERAQAAAPTQITLHRLTIIASGTIPVYLSPGTTYVRLSDSDIGGTGSSVAIYLDAESAFHTIRGNYVHLDSSGREQLAIDGSAYNRILSNTFSGLDTGGIYLYRNCGEGGTVRHQSPQHNQILANVFYYRNYWGWNPSVWVASRNGWRSYCGDDAGYPFGSSASDLDYARGNVIAENQIYVLDPDDMIDLDDGPNYLFQNVTVSSATPRTPGCFLELSGGRKVYLRSGESFSERTSATDLSTGTRYDCVDNVVTTTAGLPTQAISFECSVEGNDAGCTRQVTCPAGKQLVALRAACQLESASLALSAVTATSWDTARVARPSDVVGDGRCTVDTHTLGQGSTSVADVLGTSAVTVGCREHDQNGGDCAVRGQAYCL